MSEEQVRKLYNLQTRKQLIFCFCVLYCICQPSQTPHTLLSSLRHLIYHLYSHVIPPPTTEVIVPIQHLCVEEEENHLCKFHRFYYNNQTLYITEFYTRLQQLQTLLNEHTVQQSSPLYKQYLFFREEFYEKQSALKQLTEGLNKITNQFDEEEKKTQERRKPNLKGFAYYLHHLTLLRNNLKLTSTTEPILTDETKEMIYDLASSGTSSCFYIQFTFKKHFPEDEKEAVEQQKRRNDSVYVDNVTMDLMIGEETIASEPLVKDLHHMLSNYLFPELQQKLKWLLRMEHLSDSFPTEGLYGYERKVVETFRQISDKRKLQHLYTVERKLEGLSLTIANLSFPSFPNSPVVPFRLTYLGTDRLPTPPPLTPDALCPPQVFTYMFALSSGIVCNHTIMKYMAKDYYDAAWTEKIQQIYQVNPQNVDSIQCYDLQAEHQGVEELLDTSMVIREELDPIALSNAANFHSVIIKHLRYLHVNNQLRDVEKHGKKRDNNQIKIAVMGLNMVVTVTNSAVRKQRGYLINQLLLRDVNHLVHYIPLLQQQVTFNHIYSSLFVSSPIFSSSLHSVHPPLVSPISSFVNGSETCQLTILALPPYYIRIITPHPMNEIDIKIQVYIQPIWQHDNNNGDLRNEQVTVTVEFADKQQSQGYLPSSKYATELLRQCLSVPLMLRYCREKMKQGKQQDVEMKG